MLTSCTRFEEEGVELLLHVGLETWFSVIYVRRRGLLYEGSVAPASRAPSRGRIAFHVLLEGHLQTSTGLRADGPALFRMPEDILEGADGERTSTIRTGGEPHVLVALHVNRDRVKGDTGPLPQLSAPGPELVCAAIEYGEIVEAGGTSADHVRGCTRLIAALVAIGHLEPGAVTAIGAPRSHGERLWDALSAFFSSMDSAPTITALTEIASISPRHADRLMKRFTEAHGLPDEGFRALTRRWRLKLATLLLSSPRLGVQRVARRVGYRNAEALANAMAADGLLPPSRYRELWASEPPPRAAGDDGRIS